MLHCGTVLAILVELLVFYGAGLARHYDTYQHVNIGSGCWLNNKTLMHKNNSIDDVHFSINEPSAQFLVFHFTYFHLMAQDYIEIICTDVPQLKNRSGYNYTKLRYDIKSQGTRINGFYTNPLLCKRVTIQYVKVGWESLEIKPTSIQKHCYGFHINEYRYNAVRYLPSTLDVDSQSSKKRSDRESHRIANDYKSHAVLMSDDDLGDTQCSLTCANSVEAECLRYQKNANFLATSRSVVRMLIQKKYGAIFCTGFVLGCEGHILTNYHCIESNDEAQALTIEFLAQGKTCAENCAHAFACSGTIIATSASLLASSPDNDLDYALILPNLSSEKLDEMLRMFGHLSFRNEGSLHERIYIPQHPSGYGKRIAIMQNVTSYGQIISLNYTGCNNKPNNIAYRLSTHGGSSGSPVIAASDQSVIGLHYCGGCLNCAISSRDIIHSLNATFRLPYCALISGS